MFTKYTSCFTAIKCDARKLILLLLFFFAQVSCFSNNYYISSSSGNDAYSKEEAQRPSTPWQSISRLNSSFAFLLPGDHVYFKKGDSFFGTINITKSGSAEKPIVIGAYGAGPAPLITGFMTITGWTNEGRGIFSKVINSKSLTNMVTIGSVQYAMGRYPDDGWLTLESSLTNTAITSKSLSGTVNWKGAEAVIRKNDWSIDRCIITDHKDNTITYINKGSNQNANAGFGYFIQNDLRCLTRYGEWFHDTINGKFYMYFGKNKPDGKVIKVAILNSVLSNTGGYDYIVIDGLNFSGAIENALNFGYGNSNCTIKNCDISFAGKAGITFLSDSFFDIINNNKISYCNRTGIMDDGSVNTVITKNTIAFIGSIPGQAIGNVGYDGIYTVGHGVIVENNIIKNIGYNGITLKYTGGASVRYNLIDSVCTLLDDGAGIYTLGQDNAVRLIDHNIILNVLGNSDGTNNNSPFSVGIYLDEIATNVKVTNNTVANNPFTGIKLHKAHSNTLIANTTFNNKYGIDFEDDVSGLVYDNNMKDNIFFAKTSSQYVFKLRTSSNDLGNFGTAVNNFYLRPIDDSIIFDLDQVSKGRTYKSLTGWSLFAGQDKNSKSSPKIVTDTRDFNFQFNASDKPKEVLFKGVSFLDASGKVYNNSVIIPPFSSIILIATAAHQ